MTLREAQFVKSKIERLLSARITGETLESETAQWAAGLTEEIAAKLASAGLIESRASVPIKSLEPFVDAYIKGRAKLKPNTLRNYNVTKRYLVNFFGSDRALKDITAGDADDWREKLINDGLAEATISREVKRARQFFRAALRRKLIGDNPFADLPSPQQVNKSREHFVTQE